MVYVYRAILVSLIVHLALYWILEEFEVPELNRPQELQVQLIEKAPSERQIVRQPEVKDSPLPALNPHYLSEKNVRVEKETKAALSGITQNRPLSMFKKTRPNLNRKTGQSGIKEKYKNESGGLAASSSRGTPLLTPPGISTVGERLNDVKVGHFTALNTERFVYYSFFARIEERVRFHWEKYVEQALGYLSRSGGVGLRKREYVTEVEILINSQGHFQRALIHRTSGIEILDEAPEYSFRKGTPFINPPKEMVQDDGLIHLRYGFFVQWDPAWIARPD